MRDKTVNFMIEPEAISLLKHYDIEYPKYGLARSINEAKSIAREIGYPVVLKIVSLQVIHKSDVGGVKVNISDDSELEKAYKNIVRDVSDTVSNVDITGILVCKQAEDGQEMIIGSVKDEVFGQSLMIGLGGIFTEILNDVSFRICPVDEEEAAKMIQELKGFKILKGARGKSSLDIESLSQLLEKVSTLLREHPEIKQLDLNPVRIYKKGVKVLDARIILG